MGRFHWSFAPLILLFNYTVVFVSAGCIWYDECGDGWNGRKLNCNYTGPAKPLTNVTGLDLLQTYCPDLYHGNDSVTCCSTNQLMTIADYMDLPKQLFSRCPACYHNFLNIYCDMTCHPDQDKFVWVSGTRKNPDQLAVTAITYVMAEEFAWGMFNSCKDVQMPSANDKAISIFCGTKAEDCTPQKWLSYNGDVSNGNAPFPIEFKIRNTNWTSPNKTVLVPQSHKMIGCSQTFNDYSSLHSVLEDLAARNQISADQLDLFLRFQNDIGTVLFVRPFFRTEQVLISRPANQQSKVSHNMPPPSEDTIDFTSLFDKDFMKEVLELQTNITNLVAVWNGRNVTLSDICFKPLAPDYEDCTIESPLQYYQNDPKNLDKIVYDESGFEVLADYLDHFLHCVQDPASITDFTPLSMSCLSKYGGPVFPRFILKGFNGDNYQNSTAFVLTFVVNNHLNEEDNAMAEAWEKVFIDYMKNYKNDHMIISFSSEGLVNDLIPAADKNVQNYLQKLLKAGKTAKDELFNGIVKDMIECGDKFPGSMSHQSISEQVLVLVNALWYISGNMSTIEERAAHLTRIKHIPERFLKFDGANDYKRKKQKRPQLTAKDLKLQVQCLFRLISRPFTQHWTIRGDIETLTGCLQSYADYLEKANEKQISRQLQMNPVRQIDSNLSIAHRPRQDEILPCYSRLDGQVSQMAMFQPIFFDEDLHLNEPFKGPEQRFRYFEKLCLTIPVHMLRYDPGGGIGAISFIWRIPEDGMSSSEMFMRDNQVLHSLRSKLPEYHTRQMRQEFFNAYGNIAGTIIPPHILRSIYTTFTNDASADQNKEIDNRVRLSVLGIDPDLVVDLRHLNKGRPNDTFYVFFQTLEKEIQDMVAADERRHNTEHISRFLSVRDMIEQVKSKVPEGTNIPSESSVLLAFVPKNAHQNVAKLYKGRVPIRLKVQTRQLRTQHQHDHYCSALFKYCRAYATQFRDISNFVCMDDKSKLDFGEPDLFTSTGVRGKKSIVPMNSVLSCLDHDVQSRGSLTPSVVLDVDIPGDATETFYRGQVSVTFKDSIFQASTSFRHIVELETILKAKNENKPALFMYTDGGPDHRVTYGAVKLSLIVLFRRLQLEFLVACRTAPGHSWTNPAERIMSLLNIAFQNTALARELASSDVETILKTCGSMNEIRTKAVKNNQIKTEWLQSVQPMIKTLSSRTERVQLKEKSFKVFKAAEDADVEMAEAEVTLIDPAIKVGKYQQQQLSHATQLKKFIADHCRERHYSFQIRRCHDEGCCPTPEREWAWLPDPILDITGQHYKPFDELLGKETTDKDRPSSLKQTVTAVAQERQGCKNSILVGQNVRQTVNCCECLKPRCIYAKTKLTARDQRALTHTLEKYDYTCGSVITPDGDILQGKVFVRLQLSCAVHIEFPYYASNIGRPDICAHCGAIGAEKSQEMTGRFRTVLPVCQQCLASGKDIPKRNPVKN